MWGSAVRHSPIVLFIPCLLFCLNGSYISLTDLYLLALMKAFFIVFARYRITVAVAHEKLLK